ncbi:hypothetical protein TSUD_239380 [Trifolium subterraneum]|uniref:Uncharacterized protein n=1 Tax=Trifolium subterraneum TaxID=3900 RepID=A0A2Z6P3H4_TRISU|nr:hypothetical protein TSUD_239380 [Trifolium subterraneum]
MQSLAVEYETQEVQIPIEIPLSSLLSPLPPLHLGIPVKGVTKGGIGWPITIGGEVKFKYDLNVAIQVLSIKCAEFMFTLIPIHPWNHNEMKLGGEWQKSDRLAFQIEMNHIPGFAETIGSLKCMIGTQKGTAIARINNHGDNSGV